MKRILDDIIVKAVGNDEWEVYEDFVYHLGSADSNRVIIVKKGFRTDFASVPRPFWAILPPHGKYRAAALVHDMLYSVKGVTEIFDRNSTYLETFVFSRKECDQFFLEIMHHLEVPWWKKHTMYHAVRRFGQKSWDKKWSLKVFKEAVLPG